MRPMAGRSRSAQAAPLVALAIAGTLLLAPSGRGAAGPHSRYPGNDPVENGANPCLTPERKQLLCPNLRMSRPSHMYFSHSSSGRLLLHAQSSLNSRGEGPMELHGIRIPGTRLMRVNQAIDRQGGGK